MNDADNPGKLRYQMHMNGSQAKTPDCQDWNEKRIVLDFTEDRAAFAGISLEEVQEVEQSMLANV